MGQQQLLLLVMGIVITGFSIVAGWNAADKQMRQSSADALLDRCLTIATDAIAWKSKSGPFFGGVADYDDLAEGGMQKLFLGQTLDSGTYKITTAAGDSLVLVGVSSRFPSTAVQVTVVGTKIQESAVRHDGSITLD